MDMTRQQSLEIIWRKLVITIVFILTVMAVAMIYADKAKILTMMFIVGNLGGYAAIHRNISSYSDEEIHQLSKSWFGLALPPIIGGVLAMVMYLLFIANILSGELFPEIVADEVILKGFDAIFSQHAEAPLDYAKMLFWGFVRDSTKNM